MTTDYMDMMTQFETPSNPFPGLRTFEFNESLLYFGRDGHIYVSQRLGHN